MNEISILDVIAKSNAEARAIRESGLLAHLGLDKPVMKPNPAPARTDRDGAKGWLKGNAGRFTGVDASGMACFQGVTL